MPQKIIVLVGPTASGKTALAVQLAHRFDGEVVSADSMQVYRGMDIGTAKPTVEEREGIVHHMLDVADPSEDFSVARYVAMADPVLQDILSRGKVPILAGGTGLYVDSLIAGRNFAPFEADSGLRQGLEDRLEREGSLALLAELERVDPETAGRLHPNDRKRIVRALEIYESTGRTITQHNEMTQAIPPKYQALTLGLDFARREDLWRRIDLRVDKMVAEGLTEEIRGLLARGLSPGCTAMQAIGYKEFLSALQGQGSLEQAAQEVKLRSRQYAKRQRTWFRRNQDTRWIYWEQTPDFVRGIQCSTAYVEEFGIV